jgi:hypothetical protein
MWHSGSAFSSVLVARENFLMSHSPRLVTPVQLASVSRSCLVSPVVVSGGCIALALCDCSYRLWKGHVLIQDVEVLLLALALASLVLILPLQMWRFRRIGLRADADGLVWGTPSLLRLRLVRVRWVDIQATRVLRCCDGNNVLYLLLRKHAGNPYPFRRVRRGVLETRRRLVAVYDELWEWNPAMVRDLIEDLRVNQRKIPPAGGLRED